MARRFRKLNQGKGADLVIVATGAKKAQEDMNELMKEEIKVDLAVLGAKDLLANNKKPVALKPAEMLPLYEKKLIS